MDSYASEDSGRRACIRKIKFDMEGAAQIFGKISDPLNLTAYLCSTCGFCHFAHKPVEEWNPAVLNKRLKKYKNKTDNLPSWVKPGRRLEAKRYVEQRYTPIADMIDRKRRESYGMAK